MPKRSATALPALLALAAEGTAPDWVQLVPAGESRAVDGRTFRLDDPAAVIAASMEAGLDLPIDWEHAQDRRAGDGGTAPAAGWIVELAERGGAIWGRVQWTERGRASVEGREYRYVSPSMLQHRQTGRVLRIVGAGLVNRPALVMPALARQSTSKEPDDMDKDLLAALGLGPEASKADALEAVGTLKGDLQTARARAQTPSLDRFVPRADYDAVVARAETAETTLADRDSETREAEIAALVDGAVTAGKIAPANRGFYVATAREEGGLERLKTFVESAPQVVAKSGLDDREPPGGSPLTDAETVVCRQLGMTEEDFAKARDGEAR